MKYNKLVRDKIPEIIKQDGGNPVIHTASDKEYWEKLKQKFQEEVDEFSKSESEEELADILEVIYAICESIRIDKEKLEKIRQKKHEQRGGFRNKIVLDEIK